MEKNLSCSACFVLFSNENVLSPSPRRCRQLLFGTVVSVSWESTLLRRARFLLLLLLLLLSKLHSRRTCALVRGLRVFCSCSCFPWVYAVRTISASDDAIMDRADGTPPCHDYEGNVGRKFVHPGVPTVLVRFFFKSQVTCPRLSYGLYWLLTDLQNTWKESCANGCWRTCC